jgi:hypothetical protein
MGQASHIGDRVLLGTDPLPGDSHSEMADLLYYLFVGGKVVFYVIRSFGKKLIDTISVLRHNKILPKLKNLVELLKRSLL